ncbi:NAD(P)-binding protein [Dendrothele bispora CBS 962.96]|uniref:NAD(P)-binding protein n=1 Tax=Dendrothele bispora (strain CBS 962.96) TaxID=1314807 RepID=A0A4S8MVU6_DENBC|nr:NAD(P)-binding protein [Dendrothele bispora CBS 962.96]
MSLPTKFTRIVLNSRPVGDIEPDTFRVEQASFDSLKQKLGDNDVLVQVTWLSLDPAMRGWLRDTRSYLPPVQIGEVMRSSGLGTVIAKGKNCKLSIGQLVTGTVGWTEYVVLPEKQVTPLTVPKGIHDIDFLNNIGMAGYTAYFGLKDVGSLRPGETLVVSGAAGAVGSLTCQLGKQMDAKVFAIAGSSSKCDWLVNELGVDGAFNYKEPGWQDKFKKQVGYLDVFFDNVGGDMLDFCLTRLNKDARIVLCGAISAYNSAKPKGLQNYLTLIAMRAKIQGFIVFDYAKRYPEATEAISKGLIDGTIKRKFHIVEGIEKAPEALPMLFTGGNTGKLVVKVADPIDVRAAKL